MINVDIGSILNDLIGEGADPASCYDTASFVAGEPDRSG